jgi:hypothetical protein
MSPHCFAVFRNTPEHRSDDRSSTCRHLCRHLYVDTNVTQVDIYIYVRADINVDMSLICVDMNVDMSLICVDIYVDIRRTLLS